MHLRLKTALYLQYILMLVFCVLDLKQYFFRGICISCIEAHVLFSTAFTLTGWIIQCESYMVPLSNLSVLILSSLMHACVRQNKQMSSTSAALELMALQLLCITCFPCVVNLLLHA